MHSIHPTAEIEESCSIGEFSVVHENVQLGPHVKIGSHCVIHANTIIKEGCIVADHVVLGKPQQLAKTSTTKRGVLNPLVIGAETLIGVFVVIYTGTTLGNNCLIADHAFIRENCSIGSSVIIGRGVAVENQTIVGDFVKVQTGSYITAHTVVEDHVFIAPMVTTTNDNFMGRTEKRFSQIKGPTVKRCARVGGGSILLPGITIGEEAFIAAGSIVTKDVPPRQVFKGVPARYYKEVAEEELL